MRPRLRRRALSAPRALVLAGLVLAVLSVSGCSSDDGADASDASSAATTVPVPSSTSSADPSTEPTVPPTTAAPVVASFPTPTAAGAALFTAWMAGDRAAAGSFNLAPAAELDKLFAAVPLGSAKNRGCDEGEFDAASCFFGNGDGGVNVSLAPAPGGWAIATIDPFG